MPSASGAAAAAASDQVPEVLSRLAHVQLDALREVANIGAGHAATALSEMTGRAVEIGVPTVSVAQRGAISEVVGRHDMPMVLARVRAEGAFSGGLVVALTEPAARQLTNLLLGRESLGDTWFDALGASAVKEIGNVLGAAYLNALAQLTGWTIPISTPRLVFARAGWAMSLLCVDSARCDIAICLDTSFKVEGATDAVKGHVLLFPRIETVHTLLEAIGA